MVKLSSSQIRRGIRILEERCKKYEIELNDHSQTIRKKKHERKKLSRKTINQERRTELREMIKEKQKQQTKLMKRISKTKNQKIPKWKLILKEREARCVQREDELMMNYFNKKYQEMHPDGGKEVAVIPEKRKPFREMSNEELVNLCYRDDRVRARKVVDKLRKYLIQSNESGGFDIDCETYPGYFHPFDRTCASWGIE